MEGARADSSDAGASFGDDRRTTQLVLRQGSNGLLPAEIGLIREGLAVGEQLDAFRELRTRLLTLAESASLRRLTVLVAPVTNKSGASFVARNLAAAFTLQEDRRAILVDCNVRNPTQHEAFDLSDSSDGLFNYLEAPDSCPERMLYRTDVTGLYLIPGGRPSAPSREYFSSNAMRNLLSWLQKSVSFPPCFLVLDGPPVIGLPDARILSELVDFVVLVAGYGRDTVVGVEQAAALFDPAKFAGVVFNTQD